LTEPSDDVLTTFIGSQVKLDDHVIGKIVSVTQEANSCEMIWVVDDSE
jgi:hypothetical protein